jgi:two-component system response regulator (stage 0 sporulation protein F)
MVAPVRILAVDDESSLRLSLRFVFGDAGYELTCVDNGKAALARLDANSDLYDVIIVDQKMPQLTGLELVRAIRKRGINGKIIVVSAHLSPELCKAYERMDVNVMFSKPFNVEDLRSAVDRLAV